MRSLLLLCWLAACIALVSAAPLCPSLPVQLELRPSSAPYKYQLVFAAIDPNIKAKPDFVDIHYRVNNDEAVNLRVLTQSAVTNENERAKQAQVDNVILRPGDALRAYATYSSQGYACDTPVHTFNAPDNQQASDMDFENLRSRNLYTNEYPQDYTQVYAPLSRSVRQQQYFNVNERPRFLTQAAMVEMTKPTTDAICPSIPIETDILKVSGLRNTYMVTFANQNPHKQLHWVDLHISTNPQYGWDNLRLATDMQLNYAHKVMQPGIVLKPNEVLHYFWSYRTVDDAGNAVDCDTDMMAATQDDVTHQVDINQIEQFKSLQQ